MKKTKTLWVILDLIILVLFNSAFFVAGGFDHKASLWISYGFIHFSYLMLLFTHTLIRGGKSAVVFGFALYSLSSVYFFFTFVIGVMFILISPDSYKAALLVQLVVAGLYGVALFSNMIADEYTAEAEEKMQYQIDYVKKASTELQGLLESITDKESKKKVERVYDALYSSPVKSHPNLAQTESHILMSINDLVNAVSAGNKERIISLADSLFIAVNERNRQLKISTF